MPRIAIATFQDMPPDLGDDANVAAALAERGAAAERIPWDADVEWARFDLVVIRSTWDYDHHHERFVKWADSIGERLHNSPAIVRWNSDKRYLADLAAAGLPVIPTAFVAPGEETPELVGEIVVKPTISGGGRDTGRFTESVYDRAHQLIATVHASGRAAMIQPYQATVDHRGETAVVCLDGEPSHALRKGRVLAPDEVAPVRHVPGGTGAAEIMYSPDLVGATTATAAELDLARRVMDDLATRFGQVPLYARVDMVADAQGNPMLMELEAIEPYLYLDQAGAGSVGRFAGAIFDRL